MRAGKRPLCLSTHRGSTFVECVELTLVFKTKDRSYAALDELFERGISPRHFAKTKTEVETVQTQPDASSKSAA